jgi:hypothetical protein
MAAAEYLIGAACELVRERAVGTAHPDLSPVTVVTNESRGVILAKHARPYIYLLVD